MRYISLGMRPLLFVLTFCFGVSNLGFAMSYVSLLEGNAVSLRWDAPSKKGTVLIFLSAVCPCSLSHEKKISSLIAKYPSFQFVGVHSNSEEDKAFVRDHYRTSAIPFSALIRDEGQALANQFGALKTPHAFVVNRNGEVLYRGGIDNSHTAERASVEYLADALASLESGTPIKVAETKPLGCVISR